MVQENSTGVYQHIADWSQGTRFRFKVTGTFPDDLARRSSYEYWLSAAPGSTLEYVADTASAELVHADGSSEDVSSVLVVGRADNDIVAGSVDIIGAIPGIDATDKLVLHYTCEYADDYNVGFERGNPSWAHVEYYPSETAVSEQPALSTQAAEGSEGSEDPDARKAAAETASESLQSSPEEKATVFCYALKLTKRAADTSGILPGAGFRLQDSDGRWYVQGKPWSTDSEQATVMTSASDGTLMFSGLDADDYTLVETTAPNGYDRVKPIDVKLESGVAADSEWLKASSNAVNVIEVDSQKGIFGVEVFDPVSGKGGPLDPSGGDDPDDSSNPDDPDDSDDPNSPANPGDTGKPGSSGTSGTRGNAAGSGPGLLAVTGDVVPWLLIFAGVASSAIAASSRLKTRLRNQSLGKSSGEWCPPTGR